jgi:hypothetical protein
MLFHFEEGGRLLLSHVRRQEGEPRTTKEEQEVKTNCRANDE